MSSGSPTLAESGFYDGVIFHRVIPGFMAQGGDPTGTGTGGSDLPNLKAEFSSEPHVRGVCSMARTPDPNSANSQFFICLDDATFLDSQYTVWGEVESGMEHVDALPVGEPPREPGQDRQGDRPASVVSDTRPSADHRRVGRARRRVRAAAARSAGSGWCWRRGARTGSTRWPPSSAMPARSRSTLPKPGSAARLIADVEAAGEQVELLVNNAGFGLKGRFAELDAARQREMIDLNVGALTDLCRAVAPRHDRAAVGRDPQRRLDRGLPARARTWRSISRPRPMCCRSPRRCTRN